MIYRTAKNICQSTDQQITNCYNSISNLCRKHNLIPASIEFEIENKTLKSLLINDQLFKRGKSNHWGKC